MSLNMSKKVSTEKKIIIAYCKLLNKKDGTNISFKDILDEVLISKSTFYNYFSSKDILIEHSLEIFLDDINKILIKDLELNESTVLELLNFIFQNQEITIALIRFHPNFIDKIYSYLQNLIINSKINNLELKLENAYDMPYPFALSLYISAILSVILTWAKNGFIEKPTEIITFINKSVKI